MSDVVIVGGGSAGCVLASRLTEDPTVTVTLVEAGNTDAADQFHIPVAGGRFFKTRYDWDLDTQPERGCEARRVYLPQARVLGGGSSVNGMAYIRGNRLDYDEWGQRGWSYEDILPFFRRSEDNERGADRYHGAGGPLRVSNGRSHAPSAGAFLDAVLALGHRSNADFNGEHQLGFGAFQVTQRDGRRASAASEFLRPARTRPNLIVETGVEVHRVLIERGRAVGIEGSRLDEVVTIRAEREVILAAGAYQSPKLLMLSGIGEAQDLAAHGIPVVVDQPDVGRNLQDHPHVWLSFTHDQPVSLLAAGDPEHMRRYEMERRGLLTSGGPETGGFFAEHGEAAQLQFLCLPMAIADQFLSPPPGHGVSLGASVMRPEARGRVELFSSDPTAKPRITQNYLTSEADLSLCVDGLRMSLQIARERAMTPYTTRALAAPDTDGDRDLRSFARRNVVSGHHPVGTCAMGTVVDDHLRVRGVERLRVADASVIPTIVRGNTMAPVIALAEKASDLLAA